MKEKMRKQKGFTLSELMIVVAIIAVLVSISIPVFKGQLNKAKEASDIANERAAKAAALADYYENGYSVKGQIISLNFYQYHYDASSGQVILQIPSNKEKIQAIQPYGHKYTLTQKDPVKMYAGWNIFKQNYTNSSYSYYDIGRNIDNTQCIITVFIYSNANGSVSVAEWWLNPKQANIQGVSGQ